MKAYLIIDMDYDEGKITSLRAFTNKETPIEIKYKESKRYLDYVCRYSEIKKNKFREKLEKAYQEKDFKYFNIEEIELEK